MGNELFEILNCIDHISQKSHGSKLSLQFFKSVAKQSKVVSTYLEIESDRLAVLWSIFFGLSIQSSSVDFDDYAQYTNLSVVKVMSFASEFEQLVRMKVLRQDRSSDRRRRKISERLNAIKYFVPVDIILSLTRGETTIPRRAKENLSKYQILDIVSNLLSNELYNETITYQDFLEEIEFLLEENKENQFVKQVNNFQLPADEKIILLAVCSQLSDSEEIVNLVHLLKVMFHDTHTQLTIRKTFIAGNTKLQALGLVDLKPGEFKSDREICLTENGRTILFEDDVKFFLPQKKADQKDIILATNIIEKQLFYNEKERKNLEFLTDLLRQENYNSVMNRMKDIGMLPQIMVLIHGVPGTGKTEFVYQVAKSTGRNIKRINISDTKSHFFSDSEKLTSKVFSDYSILKNSSEIDPILFIDEIDGWMGKRTVGGSSSVAQTEASIQSTILTKMSEFEGIFIGTSNLWERLSSSYHRRFGFKYEISLPDQNTRFKIWKNKMPALTDKNLDFLSETFEFSGGMIDNVVRKVTMKQVLTGNIIDIIELEEFCKEEFLENPNGKKRIGYVF